MIFHKTVVIMNDDSILIAVFVALLSFATLQDLKNKTNTVDFILAVILLLVLVIVTGILYRNNFSPHGKEIKKVKNYIAEIPDCLKLETAHGVKLGIETDLKIPLYLPDHIRRRHVHILGATGSGKTESVILNFLRQDVKRGYGAIILDAKGDYSFLDELHKWVPAEKLKVFDLSDENSRPYNPLSSGNALESAQRLFASMTWSEEYYKSKALSALQSAFQYHAKSYMKSPTLAELNDYLNSSAIFADILGMNLKDKQFEREYSDISGLRDQIRSLCVGHLSKLLSTQNNSIDLAEAKNGDVIYFRLQSLLSPQAVKILGRLVINNINFLAGTAHREQASEVRLVPTYLDEFASFACDEFADLISKARSAGFALHFSHQSVGDLEDVADGFLNRITDNSATKIILRINDPDSAEFFARSFGTRLYQKFTQKVIDSSEELNAELVGEGTTREAHQFRSSPDTFKTLPTGVGSVLIAHGYDSKEGASHVFKIKFPRLDEQG